MSRSMYHGVAATVLSVMLLLSFRVEPVSAADLSTETPEEIITTRTVELKVGDVFRLFSEDFDQLIRAGEADKTEDAEDKENAESAQEADDGVDTAGLSNRFSMLYSEDDFAYDEQLWTIGYAYSFYLDAARENAVFSGVATSLDEITSMREKESLGALTYGGKRVWMTNSAGPNYALAKKDGITELVFAEYLSEDGTEVTLHIPVSISSGKCDGNHIWDGGRLTRATFTDGGAYVYTCVKDASHVRKELIPRIKTIKLSDKSFAYDGTEKKPDLILLDSKDKEIPQECYRAEFPDKSTDVGNYEVRITFCGNYAGEKVLSYKILPTPTQITSLTSGRTAMTVKWDKKTEEVSGYQIEYATTTKFANSKSMIINGARNSSKQIRGLKENKTYYVRVRTFETIRDKILYSDWSDTWYVSTL